MDQGLSHVDPDGRPRMVGVAGKAETLRRARAAAEIVFSEGVLARVLSGELPKGAVLDTARIAGVMAAKKTAELIPLCHPLRIAEVEISFSPMGERLLGISAVVTAVDRTGVEMEAMTAAAVAALTVYDIVKAVDRKAVVQNLRLLEKEGGKSGPWRREEP